MDREDDKDAGELRPLPSTIPERRRGASTIVVAPLVPETADGAASAVKLTIDSYQPRLAGSTAAMSGPRVMRKPPEIIVPTTSAVDEILGEIRRPTSERLDVESRAASGGMGVIEIAVDRALDRRIALKTLHPHLRRSDEAVRMFVREARLTGLLDHPHIVPVYDIGERAPDRLYFAMKLVDGQTLGEIIRDLPAGRIETATLYSLLDVVTKVCDALAFAHSRGVLHCDIKPANVMVGEFGQVYVMDWGIARLVSGDGSLAPEALPTEGATAAASATDHSVIGTPCYMSPEQARGERATLDARSDVFLLGSLLYEILTRRPPYPSSDRHQALSVAASASFPPPRAVAAEGSVPVELERIVLRAMARAPADRYPTVAALREDLVRFMRGGGDFPRQTFEEGTAIVREGEKGEAAYIIVSGRCDIRKETPTGTETLMSIGPGAVFGEMAIMTEGPRTASVVTTEPTTVLVITAAVLEREMEALKPWVATLLKSLAARFRVVDTRQRATYSSGPSPARLASQVLMNVITWGAPDASGGQSMKWTDLRAELEAQLGIAPLTFFAVAERYGMELDLDRDRITLPDVAGLTETLRRELDR